MALPPSLRRHQPARRSRSTSTRSRRTSAGSASIGTNTCTWRTTTSTALRVRRRLIEQGLGLRRRPSAEEIREHRGTITAPGHRPYRDRGAPRRTSTSSTACARAISGRRVSAPRKIDMASPNINLRDPVLYRILHASHHNTGDSWCIYRCTTWRTAFGRDRDASRTRSARSSSRTTGRSTTGSSTTARCVGPHQIEFARLNVSTPALASAS